MRKIAQNYKLPYYTLSPTYSVCKDHGYLTGEQFHCPICGAATEVYSRITGYYRPVQNWNDGKAEEYKERKVYDIGKSVAAHPEKTVTSEPAGTVAAAKAETAAADGVLLFATKTCPNCRMAVQFLEKAGVPFDKIYVEDAKAEAQLYGVTQAPTLVVIRDGKAKKIVNVSNIRKYLDENAAN